MNLKTFFVQALFISSFLTLKTTCSNAVKKFQHVATQEKSTKYNQILFEYKHGNPVLSLTPKNNILNTQQGIVFHMNLSEEKAYFYKKFRIAHLKGKSNALLQRPIPVKLDSPHALLISFE